MSRYPVKYYRWVAEKYKVLCDRRSMLFMIQAGEIAHHCFAIGEEQFVQLQICYIGGQHLAVNGVHGAAVGIIAGPGLGIVLKGRVNNSAAGIHDAGDPLAPDIELGGVNQPKGMPIFVGGRSGCL